MKRAISGHIPPGQLLRYLLVGGWNTVFGYVCFFLMNSWLSRFVTWYPYIVASLSASLISISVAFLGYKWFVFRTRGNYLREWLRTLTVYSGSVLIATVALAPLVGADFGLYCDQQLPGAQKFFVSQSSAKKRRPRALSYGCVTRTSGSSLPCSQA